MAIKFITGNIGKFIEVKDYLKGVDLEQVDIELEEIQSLNAQEVIKHKLLQAREKISEMESLILVEDTSLYLSCLNNTLPGPLIKWFEQSIGIDGIAKLVSNYGNSDARAVSIIGLIDSDNKINFYSGEQKGSIVEPRGDKDFGWGPIFIPDGANKTFGEMEPEQKSKYSMRMEAVRKMQKKLIS